MTSGVRHDESNYSFGLLTFQKFVFGLLYLLSGALNRNFESMQILNAWKVRRQIAKSYKCQKSGYVPIIRNHLGVTEDTPSPLVARVAEVNQTPPWAGGEVLMRMILSPSLALVHSATHSSIGPFVHSGIQSHSRSRTHSSPPTHPSTHPT